jgi:hypothetical protein
MSTVKLPRKLVIGGHEYEVVFPHKFQEANYWGLHDGIAKKLLITDVDSQGNPRPRSSVLKTLWHEIFHALIQVWVRGPLENLEESDLENLVDSLAEGMVQFTRENDEVPYYEPQAPIPLTYE